MEYSEYAVKVTATKDIVSHSFALTDADDKQLPTVIKTNRVAKFDAK
jgi:hypothetical protein